jgi:hypothetical protein
LRCWNGTSRRRYRRDNGGNGLAVVQELLALDKYKPLQLEGRLHGYDFGGMTTLAIRDGREVKKRTKELMTSLINGALQRRQWCARRRRRVEDQFTTHTARCKTGTSSTPKATTISSTPSDAPCSPTKKTASTAPEKKPSALCPSSPTPCLCRPLMAPSGQILVDKT